MTGRVLNITKLSVRFNTVDIDINMAGQLEYIDHLKKTNIGKERERGRKEENNHINVAVSRSLVSFV